jgi:hypothetical protein
MAILSLAMRADMHRIAVVAQGGGIGQEAANTLSIETIVRRFQTFLFLWTAIV